MSIQVTVTETPTYVTVNETNNTVTDRVEIPAFLRRQAN